MKDLMLEFEKSYNFLVNHPAFCGHFHNCFSYYVEKVCKHGYSKTDYINLYKDDKYFKKYYKMWLKNKKSCEVVGMKYYKNKSNIPFEDVYKIEVKYEDYYGYKWKYNHVQYWSELAIVRLYINEEKQYILPQTFLIKTSFKEKGNFERLIIEVAKYVKKELGNYKMEEKYFKSIPSWIKDYNTEEHKKDFFIKLKKNEKTGQMSYTINKHYNPVYFDEKDYNALWWNEFGINKFDKQFDFNSDSYLTKNYRWFDLKHLENIDSFKQNNLGKFDFHYY